MKSTSVDGDARPEQTMDHVLRPGDRVSIRKLTALAGLDGASHATGIVANCESFPTVVVDVIMPERDVERDVESLRRMHEKDESLLHRWASSQIDALLLQGALSRPVLEDQVEAVLVLDHVNTDSKLILNAQEPVQVHSGMG